MKCHSCGKMLKARLLTLDHSIYEHVIGHLTREFVYETDQRMGAKAGSELVPAVL